MSGSGGPDERAWKWDERGQDNVLSPAQGLSPLEPLKCSECVRVVG